MQFVYPTFLFALLAVAIPVVIHLFHFRRYRKVYFSDVLFLRQLSDESKKQSRIRHLLVLAARVLAIVFLVFAFSRPYIPSGKSRQNQGSSGHSVVVYIDNSFSMDALAKRGRLLDEALEAARQIAGAFHSSDSFLLLTNDFGRSHQRFLTRDEFLNLVSEVDFSPSVRTLEEIINLKNELVKAATGNYRISFIISDFQETMAALGQAKPDSGINTFLIPVQTQRPANLAIDSCWFESPVRIMGQAVTLTVRIRNFGDQPLVNQPLRLYINNVQRTLASFDIDARGQILQNLTWTIQQQGINLGRLEIADYPITFDDQFFFSYQAASGISVLSIQEQGQEPFLKALFGHDTTFNFSSMPANAIDFGALPNHNMVVLNGLSVISPGLAIEAQRFAEQGGHLVIFPGAAADFHSYNNFLSAIGADPILRLDTTHLRVNTINADHPIYKGVFETLPENIDLPRTFKHFVISRQTRSGAQALMQLQNGNPFMLAYELGRGKVYIAAVALNDDFGNFQRHAVFVPTLVNIALHSGAFLPLFYTIAKPDPILVRGVVVQQDKVLVLKGAETELIPQQRRSGGNMQVFINEQLLKAENYTLFNAGKPLMGISLNYDRRESVTKTISQSGLREMLNQAGLNKINIADSYTTAIDQAINLTSRGLPLFKLFIVLVLVSLLAEVLLLRFGK